MCVYIYMHAACTLWFQDASDFNSRVKHMRVGLQYLLVSPSLRPPVRPSVLLLVYMRGGRHVRMYEHIHHACTDTKNIMLMCGWLAGWLDGWMDGWMDK